MAEKRKRSARRLLYSRLRKGERGEVDFFLPLHKKKMPFSLIPERKRKKRSGKGRELYYGKGRNFRNISLSMNRL